MKYSAVLLVLLNAAELVAASAAVRARSPYMLKETHLAPMRWTQGGPAPKDHMIHLNIGLKQGNFAELERHLYEVSDPDHERYGQHLSDAEVNALVKPSDEALRLVHEWLADNGVATERLGYSAAQDWLKIALPISEIERLLQTEYSVYEHADGDRLVRTENWSLPEHLHKHIETIQPTNSFFRASRQGRGVRPAADLSPSGSVPMVQGNEADSDAAASISSACNFNAVTPKCLRNLYGTINYTPQAMGQNTVGICNYLNETSNRSDVNLFLQQYRPAAAKYAFQFPIRLVANGPDQQTPNTAAQNAAGHDLEGNLDAETVLGISYPTPLTSFNTGGMPPFDPDMNTPTDTNEPYLTWLQYILAQGRIPQTVTTSYGDDEQSVPQSYAMQVCRNFAQLGARGTTVLFSSGDSGVGPNGTCFSNDGKNTHMFIPAFPASCPYVTTVGGTKNFPEVAAYDPRNGYATGGGFSNYFPRPNYQDKVVTAYMEALGSLYSGLYDRTGRAYPDISASSVSFITTWGGRNVLLDGTSAASPTAAGVFTLVNDALIAAGKAPLGFMNPWLYKNGSSGFTDITSGSAVGCSRAGFPTMTGWDPVTGFGTPKFRAILSLLGV